MPDIAPFDSALWIVAVAGLVWAVVPPLCTFVGLRDFESFRLRRLAPDSPPPDRAADLVVRWGELVALGFRPAGVVTETAWLSHGFHWRKCWRLYQFETPDGKCFASVFRLIRGEPVRVGLWTATSEGGAAWSVFGGVQTEYDGGDSIRVAHPPGPVADLVARHAIVVDEFTRERGTTAASETLDGWMAFGDHTTGAACTPPCRADALWSLCLYLVPLAVAYGALWLVAPLGASARLALAMALAGACHLAIMRYAHSALFAYAETLAAGADLPETEAAPPE